MMWISLILLLETEISNKRENLWETYKYYKLGRNEKNS